jgi:hypothetical protein
MARLPVPGSDENTWGDILNDYLSQSLNSDGTLKDGVVSDSAVSGSIAQSKIQNLTSDLSNKVDTTDSRLTDQSGDYPPQAFGFFATTAPVRTANASSTFDNSSLFISRVWIPAGKSISTAGAYVATAGTVGGGGTNGFAIYTDSGAQVSITPSDDNLWATTGWRTKDFSTPIAAQAAGRFVYVAIASNGYSAASYIIYSNHEGNQLLGGIGLSATKRHNMYNSTSSFPASFNPDSYASANTYLPLVGLA